MTSVSEDGPSERLVRPRAPRESPSLSSCPTSRVDAAGAHAAGSDALFTYVSIIMVSAWLIAIQSLSSKFVNGQSVTVRIMMIRRVDKTSHFKLPQQGVEKQTQNGR